MFKNFPAVTGSNKFVATVATAFMVSLLGTIFSLWQTWQAHDRLEKFSTKQVRITENIGRIKQFDEVLTMSARMTAATGDFSYEKRYGQFDPQLTTAIDKLRADLPQEELKQYVRETDEANVALVNMERQAFKLVHQGKRQEAMALLNNDRYLHLKAVYASGMGKTLSVANILMDTEAHQLQQLSVWSIYANVVVVMTLLVAWIVALRSARSWIIERKAAAEALQNSHDELETRIKQRTAELLNANTQLQQEISERKQMEEALKVSEAYFKQIFNEAPLGMALIDSLTGHIYSVNSMFAKIADKTIEEMILIDWMSITHPEDIQKDLDSMALLNAGEISGFQMEKRYLRKDGSIVWINMTIAPVYVEDKAHPRHLCMIEDITERKRTEAQIEEEYRHVASMNARLTEMNNQLKQARNQLQQSEKMAAIGVLAAGVAHEINNPIGYVNSNIGTLERYMADIFTLIDKYEAIKAQEIFNNPLAEELCQFKNIVDINYIREDVKALIAESHQGLERVKKIVLDLKEFSHVDSRIQWVSADVHQGLESTLNVIWNELKYKCELVKEYGALPKITCIPSQLNQVFMNLLINAAQAIEVRGTITLRTGQEGDRIWVEVSDTGTGIPPEMIPHLFEPFFTTKEVGKGTGLGLSVSYGIVVDIHHGNIEVHSEVGKGSTFRVWLPVQQPEDKIVMA